MQVSDFDRKLLVAHFAFYRTLDLGTRSPSSPAQRHFVDVCKGRSKPVTDHEFAYSRYMFTIQRTGIDESAAIASGFCFHTEFDVNTEFVDIQVRQCSVCHRPIPPERLQVFPATTSCVSCQHQSEMASADCQVSEIECPRCADEGFKSKMVWRSARDPAKFHGYFLGCSRFPLCRYIDES
jgi:hypothetical protein